MNDRTLQSLAKSKNLANIVTGVQIDDVFGNGKIETIECKDGYYIDSLTLDSIKQNVASWLANNNYESAIDVLMSGEKSKINELLSIYQTVEWQS